MNLLFGFGNKARHGKDTAAAAIADYYGEEGIPVMFAPFSEALRREANAAIANAGSIYDLLWYGHLDGIKIPDWVKPEPNPQCSGEYPFGKHPLLLQWWGTDYRRAQDPDYWVKRVAEKIYDFRGVVLIADVRFENEFLFIRNCGGAVIKVSRLNQDGSPFLTPDRDPNHISETTLDDSVWDFYIKARTGESDLVGSQAISIARFFQNKKQRFVHHETVLPKGE